MDRSNPRSLRILVLDIETPWIKSLFLATEPGIEVDLLGILNIREKKYKPNISIWDMFRRNRLDDWHTEHYIWTISRLRTLTRLWVRFFIWSRLAKGRPYDAIILTDPFGAHLVDALPPSVTVYYAHDVFEFYPHLQSHPIQELEQKLLESCDVVAAVARRLVADFQARRAQPVIHLPMAANSSWLGDGSMARPSDLPDGMPIVGCTGQINSSYDWDLIEQIANNRRDFFFVFVGPNIEGNAENRAHIEKVFALPNVRWLGPKPHSELRSYINAFDICFCPLVINEHNDRRSPLRLFDYLTTEKPVVCTPIAEASEHEPHLIIAKDAQELDRALSSIKEGSYIVVPEVRREYMKGQTWESRASQLLVCVRAMLAAKASS